MSSVVEQIAVLEREQARLEGLLGNDRNWRALQELRALNGSSPADSLETEQRLKRLLAGNPYYAARLKIVEAVTILRRLREGAVDGAKTVPGQSDEGGATSGGPLATPLGVPLFGEIDRPSRPILLYGTDATEIAPAPSASQPANSSTGAAAPERALTAIRNITPEQAAELERLGVSCFTQIANWTAADVKRISDALGLKRTISKENWIEQAALLDRRSAQAPALAPAVAPLPAGEGDTVAILAEPGTVQPGAGAPISVVIEPSVTVLEEVCAPLQAGPTADTPEFDDRPPSSPEPLSPRDWLAQRRRAVAQIAQPSMVEAAPDVPVTLTHDADLEREISSRNSRSFVPPGEAEVTISTARQGATSSGARTAASLRARLRPPAPVSPEINPADHAGYTGNIEEATVQIVEHGQGAPGGLKSAIAAAIPDKGRVSRFLSVLKGSK